MTAPERPPGPDPGADVSRPPRRYGRARLALMAGLRRLGEGLLGGRRRVARTLARPGGLELARVAVPVPGLHPDLAGLRLVQLSDLHAGPFLDEAALAPAVALAAALEPDLLVLTGDLITDTVDDRWLLGRALARIRPRLGAFAVFGNHDYRQRREGELVAWLRRQGIVALRNASARVERGGGRLRVVGLEDIEEGRGAHLDRALADADPGDHATVLLCHHPAVEQALPPGRFDLVLCGHTHGGQIVLPGWGPLAHRALARRPATRPLAGGGWLHVNRGLGTLILPLRPGAPAQVSCLTLEPASGARTEVGPGAPRG